MGATKHEIYRKDVVKMAELLKAIAHPARIAILKVLAEKQSCICGEIVEGLPLAQSTVSQHLKELKNAGLIQGTISGPKSCYCINGEKFIKFQAAFNALFAQLENQNQTCC